MNELSTQERQLPETLEDLSKFVLIGREKLNSVRAEIRAIERVQLAAEVHEQKLQEAQEIAEAVLDAETKLGELTRKMEKAVNQHSAVRNGAKTKKEQLEEVGINKDQASRFETLASHPEAVEKAKANARAQDKIVTRQDVFNEINAEIETRWQREARELREAKQRAEEYEPDKVVQIGEAKQHADDNKLILGEFKDLVYKAFTAVNTLAINADKDIYAKPIKTASPEEQEEIRKDLTYATKALMGVKIRIMEVISEK